MMPEKRFALFALVVFAGLVGLSTYCDGDSDPNCGFGSGCPGVRPPCYKVTFQDVNEYCEWDCNGCEPSVLNGTYYLLFDEYDENGCYYGGEIYKSGPNGDYMICLLIGGGVSVYLPLPTTCFKTEGPRDVGTGANEYGCYVPDYPLGPVCSHGTASWEPIWDCNECNVTCDLDVNDSNYKDTIYYANLDCCPPGEKGEYTEIIFECNDANFVVPIYTIEESHPNDPNAPDDWVEVTDSNLVDVNPYPSECSTGNKVRFRIQALKGRPPAKARVKVDAAFYKWDGTMGSGTEKTVMVLPQECDCPISGGGGGGGCSGGICGIGGGGEPPPSGGEPHPIFEGP
jgi:hypothetical protein